MAFSFDATYYLTARPDVFQAYVAAGGSTGLTWEQFAEQHYNTHGRFEGSNPNAVFNTNEYLAANPDVAAAGVNPFQHYLTHGVHEGRAPNATFPARDAFDWQAYLDANPDLGLAGIDTAEAAYVHFVMHGQFENRPGVPADDLTLTQGKDVLTGTSGDDVFNAPRGLVIYNDGPRYDPTLQSQDVLDGGAGNDTLIAELDGGTTNPTLTSIENLVLTAYDGSTLDLIRAEGVETITNTGSREWLEVINVGAGVDLELDNVRSGMELSYDDIAVATQSVVANRVGAAGNNFDLNINGVVNPVGAGEKFTLDSLSLEVSGGVYLDLDAPTDALVVSGTGALELVSWNNFAGLQSFDSTGYNEDRDLRIDLSGADDLQSLTSGASHDTFVISNLAVDGELAIDLGEGNNDLRVNFDSFNPNAAHINALDFSGGVANVPSLTLESNGGNFNMFGDAVLDLDGFDANLSSVNFQNMAGDEVSLNSNGNDFAINNGPEVLTVNAAFVDVSGGVFGLDTTVDLTVNSSVSGIWLDDINSATLETLTINAETDALIDTISDDDHVLSALTTLDVTAGGDADVIIDATTHDEADVDALTSVNIVAGDDAYLELTGDNTDAVVGVAAGFDFTLVAGGADGAAVLTINLPGGVTRTVNYTNTAADLAATTASLVAALQAAGFVVASPAAGDVEVTYAAVGAQPPVLAISTDNGGALTFDPVAGQTDGADPVNGVGFAGLETVVVEADAGFAEINLEDVYGEFTVVASSNNDSGANDVEIQLTNTAVTSIVATAAAGDVDIEVDGNTIGGANLATITVVSVSADIDLDDDLTGLTTIDVSAVTEEVDIDVSGATLAGVVTYNIGFTDDGDALTTDDVNISTNVGNGVREIFSFVGSDIGSVEISGFDGGNALTTADYIDLSNFAVVTVADLIITQAGGAGTDVTIEAAGGQFEGTITLVGNGTLDIALGQIADNILFA